MTEAEYDKKIDKARERLAEFVGMNEVFMDLTLLDTVRLLREAAWVLEMSIEP